MTHRHAFPFFTLFILLFSTIFATVPTIAQTNPLILEHEQHYETYGIGGTCIFATQNIALSDVDSDNDVEIITGGFTYGMQENGTRANSSAPLKIWNWDNKNLTLEVSYKWPANSGRASITCVYAADINLDNTIELITAGGVGNETGGYTQLRIWHWDGYDLTLVTNKELTLNETASISSVFVADVDKDGSQEILSTGRFRMENNRSGAQLCVWHWNGQELSLQKSMEWNSTVGASSASIRAADTDNDGTVEIVTAGYNYNIQNSSGQLCVWHWNGQDISLQANAEWKQVENGYGRTIVDGVQGNTVVNNLKIGDVDKDGTQEIITGGFTFDGQKTPAQLRIWNYSGQTVSLEKSQEWLTRNINEVKAIALNDVDGDGEKEIVASGVTAGKIVTNANTTVEEYAQLKLWNWNNSALTLKQSEDWTVGEGVCAWNVASGDVDGDNIMEIVTVGCMFVSTLCDPDLRIWATLSSPVQSPIASATPQPPAAFSLTTELIIVAIASVTVITLVAYSIVKKSKNRKTVPTSS